MQCSSCGTTLQPGMTTCPSCGATVAADTSDSSYYESDSEAVPYIPYTSAEHKAPEPASSAPSETPEPEQSLHDPSPQPNASLAQDAASGKDIGLLPSESWAGEIESSATEPASPADVVAEQGTEPQPVLATHPDAMHHARRRVLATSVIALLILLALLVIGSGGGLTYYVTTFHPAELKAKATAVAQNVLTEATARTAAINPQVLYTQIVNSKPTISDPLNDTNTSIWEATPSCNLTNGAYHSSIATKSEIIFCRAVLTDFHNFAFQVQMTTIKGDLGGLMFRSSLDASSQVQSYFFGLDSRGGFHLFTLQGGVINVLGNGTSSAATTGTNKTNLLTVIAQGSRFYLYVNRQFAAVINDKEYGSGGVGMFALDLQNPTEVVFNNAQVWAL